MIMEHLPRPWYLAAMAGLSITEFVRPENERRDARPARRHGGRCDRRRRRMSDRRRRAPHLARYHLARN